MKIKMFFTNTFDRMSLCRICLVTERVDISIFEVEGENDFPELLTKINVCLPIKVAKGDNLPKKICVDCLCKLESFYQFYNISAQAEKQLLSWLGEEKVEESQEELNANSQEILYDSVDVVIKSDPVDDDNDQNNFYDDSYSVDESYENEKPQTSGYLPKEEKTPKKKPEKKDETKPKRIRKKKPSKKKKFVIMDKITSRRRNKTNKVGGKFFCKILGPREYACLECEEKFTKKGDARAHFKDNHIQEEIFKCDHCEKIFTKLHPFKLHRTEHGIDKNAPVFFCDKCDFKTAIKMYFEAHVAQKHSDEFKYDCDHCGKKFKVKTNLRSHMGIHENVQHMCDLCGKFFPSSSALYHHRRVKHINTYNFICSICNFKSISQANLDNHVRDNHDPNNPFKCKDCGQQFKVKRYLLKHQKRVHEKLEKPHLCTVCGKSFVCANTYRIHFLTHTKIKPYQCNVCGESFSQRSSLMLHWKKKHPDAEEPPPPIILSNIFETLQLDKADNSNFIAQLMPDKIL